MNQGKIKIKFHNFIWIKEKCSNKILSCDIVIALNAYIISKKKERRNLSMLDKKLEMKSSFGEIKVIDIKMKEETSKYEKSWRKITVEGNKRVKATFIWKKIKLINDVWRIEKTWIIYIYINMKIQCSCFCKVASVVSDSVRPHRRHPARLSIPGILQTRTQEWVAISFSSAWKWEVKVQSSVVSDS